MRVFTMASLMMFSAVGHAGSVQGFCERDGKRLEFTDGLAFADAREGDTTFTTIYLTAKTLDRAALAACVECRGPLPEDTFNSPRGNLIERQKQAISDGWAEIAHASGEMDHSTLVNLMYFASDGMQTGIDGGNGRTELDFDDAARTVKGTLTSEAREAPFNETDMNCDVSFDLPIGWPE